MKVHKQTVLRNAAILGSAAVMAVGAMGDASAGAITSISAYPTLGGAPFMGNTGTTFGVRVKTGGGGFSTTADEVKLFFVSANKQVLRSATMTPPTVSTNANGLFTYTVTASDIAGATHVVVAYKDTVDTVETGVYGYVDTANAMDGKTNVAATAFASTAEVVAEAITPVGGADTGGLIPIYTSYTGLKLERQAFTLTDDTNANETAVLEYSADLYTDVAAATAPAAALALNGNATTAVLAGTNDFLWESTAGALVSGTQAILGTGRGVVLSPARDNAGLDTTIIYKNAAFGDGSSTTTPIGVNAAGIAVTGAYTTLAPAIVAATATTKSAVAVPAGYTNDDLEALYSAQGLAANIDVYVRTTMPATEANAGAATVTPAGITVTGNIGYTQLDASGQPTQLKVALANTTGRFRFNGGKLQWSATPTTASSFADVKVTIPDSRAKYAYEVASGSAATSLTQISDIGVGVAQGPLVSTLDSNADGWIDGVTVDFRQAVGDPAATLKLVSNPASQTAFDSPISTQRVTFGTTVTAVTANQIYTAKLALPDVPVVANNGSINPPTTANNDWNASGGTADATDAALVTQGRFNTSVTGDNVTDGIHDQRPFHATLISGLAYSSVYDKATGGVKSLGYYDFLNGEIRDYGDVTFTNADGSAEYAAATNKVVRVYNDGAAPVVQRVSYAQTDAATATRGAFGNMNVFVSENVHVGTGGLLTHGMEAAYDVVQSVKPLPDEFLLDGTPLSLINMGAVMKDAVSSLLVDNSGNITDQYGDGGAQNGESSIQFTNMPASVLTKVLSLTSFVDVYQAEVDLTTDQTAVDATVATKNYKSSDFLLIKNGTAAANTVVDGGGGFKLASASVRRITSGDNNQKIDQITATFSQAVKEPASQVAADRDGMFIVRAMIGERRGPVFENRDRVYVFQDFRIPGADVAISTAAAGSTDVVITMPATGTPNRLLPTDTVAVYVDYQPGPATGTSAGRKYVNIASTNTPVGTEYALGDQGKPFDNAAAAGVAVPEEYGEVPVVTNAITKNIIAFDQTKGAVEAVTTGTGSAWTTALTLTGDAVTPIVATDNNTVVKVLPAYLAETMAENSDRLYTMTVKGTLTDNSVAVPNGTGVQVSLVRVRPGDLDGCATSKRSSSVNQAWATIKRGPNSDNGDTGNANNVTGQTVALANKAVTGADLDRYITALDKMAKATAALSKAQAENRPGADVNKLSVDYDVAVAEANAAENIYSYVLVTTGTGTDVKDGAATAAADADAQHVLEPNHGNNPNATYGRTAVLVKAADLPNRRNGETVYPVTISLKNRVSTSSSPVDLEISGRVDSNHNGVVSGSSTATKAAFVKAAMLAVNAPTALADSVKVAVENGALQATVRTMVEVYLENATNTPGYVTGGGADPADDATKHVIYTVADAAMGAPTAATMYTAGQAATATGFDHDNDNAADRLGIGSEALAAAAMNAFIATNGGVDDDGNGVVTGGLTVTWGSLGMAEKRKPATLEIVNRAWATADSSGKYRAIVGVAERPIPATVGATGGSLSQEISNDKAINDLFVLVSVRHPTTGTWVQVNSADPAMAKFLPFKADLETKAANVINADLSLVKTITVKPSGWNLLPFNAKLDWKDATKTDGEVDLARMMIGADPLNGDVTTGWSWDHGNAEMAFTMGTPSAGNTVAVAFQVGKNVTNTTVGIDQSGNTTTVTNGTDFGSDPGAIGKSKINLRDGAGLAVTNNDAENSYDVEADSYRFTACVGQGRGRAARLALVSNRQSSDFKFQVPIKSGTPAPVLKQGWHLMSLAAATSTDTLAGTGTLATSPAGGKGVGAVVWFDSNRKANTWFKGETALTLAAGTTAFMYEELTTNPAL